MSKTTIYEPIIIKLNEWITYDENEPKVDYREAPELHDAYRREHDRDCILTDGNLHADTIFSLWLPLRNTIVCLNDADAIEEVGDIYDKMSFVRALVQDDNLEKLLPAKYMVVEKLSRLFELGMKRGNVMILPERWINSARGKKPYYDYMPVFLLESFPGGEFADAWNGLEDFIDWIYREYLEMFFDGEISPENICDLAGIGDLRVSRSTDGIIGMERLIDQYIEILRERNFYCNIAFGKHLAGPQDYNTDYETNESEQKEVPMKMSKPTRQIIINNFSKVEDYLNIGSPWEETLKYVELDRNVGIKGVEELLEKIPTGFTQDVLEKFYAQTGLKIQVQMFKDYDLTMYDREGRYPREDAAIWNPDFLEQIENHPEWLEPQEEADIVIRIVFPMLEDEEGQNTESDNEREDSEQVVNNIFIVQM